MPIERGKPRRKVIVWLRGGLGNQMFQYALGRSIAERQGRELVLDTTWLDRHIPRTTRRMYSLNVFAIDTRFLTEGEMEDLPALALIVERRGGFCPAVLEPSPFDCLYVRGFWQDERYFADIEGAIRFAFQLRAEERRESAWSRAITAERTPVCVHVRRQDYLTHPDLGFVGKEYYSCAIDVMAQKVKEACFFVFSDDIDWCEANLDIEHPHSFVRHEGSAPETTVTDFSLMMRCRHFVIANSSYSWWAAWLGTATDKAVVAPRKWFKHEQGDNPGTAPSGWIRL